MQIKIYPIIPIKRTKAATNPELASLSYISITGPIIEISQKYIADDVEKVINNKKNADLPDIY